MSKFDKYPRLGQRTKDHRGSGPHKKGKLCLLCKAQTLGKVTIETDIFRGNDDVVAICNPCQKARMQEVLPAWEAKITSA
jgi:hypothetical protein